MSKKTIDNLIDKDDIADVLNCYFRALDEKYFDIQHFAGFFAADARVIRPDGSSITGVDKISASHARSFERFESSQHLVAGYDIAVSGDKATVRANLVAMHMWQGSKANANNVNNLFVAGGVIHASLVREDGLWKITQIGNNVTWRAGGFRDMLQTGR